MMGQRQVDQAALFYAFSLERHVPASHLLRSIDRFVDFRRSGGTWLAGSLGARVDTSCIAEGTSFLDTFPLTEAEQRAAWATRVFKPKRRKVRRPQGRQASGTQDLEAG